MAIASGKGGTGKTLVATNLAVLLSRAGRAVTLVDCDVEAPNGRLFLPPASESAVRPVEVPLAVVDESACAACGACRDACRYGAIRMLAGRVLVFAELCHGCGACELACPIGAMGEERRRVGEVEAAVSAEAVRMVAAVRDADLMLLVTEPTAFGLHDLDLSYRLGRQLGLPMAVVVNRADAGAADIDGYCAERGLPVVARIPFDAGIAAAYADGRLVLDAHEEGPRLFADLWERVESLLDLPEAAETRS